MIPKVGSRWERKCGCTSQIISANSDKIWARRITVCSYHTGHFPGDERWCSSRMFDRYYPRLLDEGLSINGNWRLKEEDLAK